jgi:hypothetical protein
MARFVVYPTPLDAEVKLSPDSGGTIILSPYTDPNGRPGQVGEVADSTPSGHGATLNLEAPGYESLRLRGFLVHDLATARLQVDDYTLTATPQAPPDPGPTPPSGPRTPLQIIEGVYATGQFNLATHDGCGEFTEACCTALHEENSTMWGHIQKNPGQNQYNGHAVDAVMALANVPGASAGIYDIIYSSASPEAKPVFNWVEPPNYDLWFYPANARTRGVQVVAVPLLIPRD